MLQTSDLPDQGRTDDDAVRHRGQHAHVFGATDSEADADGQRCLLAEPADLVDDFGQSIVKSIFFGIATTLIATYAGYHAPPTIEGTSIATTRSVVMGSLMVLCLDFILSATLY